MQGHTAPKMTSFHSPLLLSIQVDDQVFIYLNYHIDLFKPQNEIIFDTFMFQKI